MLLDPKRELFIWGPIEGRLLYASFFVEAFWLFAHHPPELYPWPWPPMVGWFARGTMTYVLDDAALRQVGVKYFRRYFLNKKNYRRHWQRWREWVRQYQRSAHRYQRINWRTLSDRQLHEEFARFWVQVRKFWHIVHVPEIANWGGEKLLRQILRRIDRTRADEYLEILAAPVCYSFFQQEELDLLQVARSHGVARRKAVERHAEQYRWILNSYGGNRRLGAAFFAKKLRNLLRGKNAAVRIGEIQQQRRTNVRRKRALARRVPLSRRTVLIADQLSLSIWWQDLRKSYIWRMHEWLDLMLHEVNRRTGWRFDELVWCWPWEILRLLERRHVDRRKILQRKNFYVQTFRLGKLVEAYGKQRVNVFKRRYLHARSSGENNTLRGLVVSRTAQGNVSGMVTIIRNPFTDIKKMRRGNILVAAMTSPEFIVAMRKAAAIVTDHGGMTSHAAIVSRELGIPCIVGTKISTQMLKDGDRVEVDATRGIVRKLTARPK